MTRKQTAAPSGCSPPEPGSRHPWLADSPWLAALWLASLVVFAPVLLGDSSFYFRDTASYYYPQAAVTVRALAAGEVPLWEPTIGLGYPFQADPHSMVFYPLTVLLLLLPMPRAYDVFVWAHVPLAGSFVYLLVRRWGYSRSASALAGFVMMFSGYTISATCLTTLLRGLTWIPAALLAFEPFLAHGSRRALVATALVLALQGSGTDPQYVLFTIGLLAVAPWLRPLPRQVTFRSWAVGLFACGLLAGALLAYQYLPLAQLFTQSDRVGGVGAEELSTYGVDPLNLYNLFVPLSFPDPAHPYYLASFHGAEVPFYPDLYWGLPVLVLSLTALGWIRWNRRRDDTAPPGSAGERGRAVLASAAVFAAGIALSLGDLAPFFGVLTELVPPLAAFRYPGKYFLFAAAVLPWMVAAGFDGLRESAGCRRLFGRIVGASLIGLVVASSTLWVTGLRGPQAFLSWRLALVGDATDVYEAVRHAWFVSLGFALALAASLGTARFLHARSKLPPAVFLSIIGGLAVADLGLATFRSFPVGPDSVLAARPKTAAFLGGAPQPGPPPRFVTFSTLQPVFNEQITAFAFFLLERELLSGLRGCAIEKDSLLASMSVRLASQSLLQRIMSGASKTVQDRFAAACGARWVLRPESPVASPGRLVGRSGPVSVFELACTNPRAFLPKRALAVAPGTSLQSAPALVGVTDEALFERPPDLASLPISLSPRAIRRCDMVSYSRHRLEVSFDVDGEALLVLLEADYPGWHARVDGEERPIVRVAGLFRGVPVKGGDRHLVMTYEPRPFQVGAAMTLLALLLATAVLMKGGRR